MPNYAALDAHLVYKRYIEYSLDITLTNLYWRFKHLAQSHPILFVETFRYLAEWLCHPATARRPARWGYDHQTQLERSVPINLSERLQLIAQVHPHFDQISEFVKAHAQSCVSIQIPSLFGAEE